MTRSTRVSGYQLVLAWMATVCALVVASAIWPDVDRVLTSLSDGALIVGTILAATYLGWVACAEIWKAIGRRRQGADEHARGPQ